MTERDLPNSKPLPSKEARAFFGYPTDDTQYEMLGDLGDLAAKWAETQDPQYIDQYHKKLRALMDLGWDDYIDADSELPRKHMPDFYLDKFKPKDQD